MRETHKALVQLFVQMCSALGKPVGEDTGSWLLDYNAALGGWKVVEHLENGGESEPFGSKRRRLGEMCDMFRFATIAVGYARERDTRIIEQFAADYQFGFQLTPEAARDRAIRVFNRAR